MESAHEAVAGEVRAELARQRLSAHKAAQQLGWSDFYISRRLKGAVPFDVNDLAAIAELLEVPVSWFFEVRESPELSPRVGVIKRKRSRPRAGLLASDLGLAA